MDSSIEQRSGDRGADQARAHRGAAIARLRRLVERLRRQAFLARNAAFNPLAERQAAGLEADAEAVLWALRKVES